MERSKDELVRRAQTGERDAFALLIGRYERMALAVAFAVLSDADGAGDAAQDAFVQAWQRVRDLREPDRFGPWLCGIVRNRARDLRRSGLRHERALAAWPQLHSETANDPAAEFQRRETGQRVAAALAELDEVTRTIVVLRYYENMPSKQIAELVDLPPAAVDMRLSRATALRTRLADNEDAKRS